MENHPEYIVDLCREMRKSATSAEDLLWRCLRGKRLMNCKFRRQHPIGRYIADFYCHEGRLIVEVDGCGHDLSDQSKHDEVRDGFLASSGYRTLRFTNAEVLGNTEAVLNAILTACEGGPHP